MAGRLLLAAASLAATLGAAEIATRVLSSVERPLDTRDPAVGKTYLPGYAGTVYVDECDCDIRLRFNREGFRGVDLPYEKPPGVRRVAVIGDSMIAAIATEERATLVARLEALLNAPLEANAEAPETSGIAPEGARWQVMNFGVSGASTAQELVLYRERVRRYDPDVVVLAFFLRNDVLDNSVRLGTNPRIYFDLDSQGRLHALPFSVERAESSAWLNRHSRFYVWQKAMLSRARGRWGRLDRSRFVFVADPDGDLEHAWEVTAALLRAFRDEVAADRARFLVAALPHAELVYDDVWHELRTRSGDERERFVREFPERRLAEICRDADIALVTMTDAFRSAAPSASSRVESETLYFQRVGHFNARANDIAARVVYEALAAAGTDQNSTRKPSVSPVATSTMSTRARSYSPSAK